VELVSGLFKITGGICLASTRIYKLAKELGVKSSAIVKKCQAEGLDVKNHMSSISVGLAETIKEWFSEGEHTTTVETSQKVDLEKVRVKKKKKKEAEEAKKQAEQAEQEKEAQAGEPEEKPTQGEDEETKPAESEQEPEKEEETKSEEPKKAEPEKEQEPEKEEIRPAGPRLEKPEPAKLSGPRVVKIAKPEPDRRPSRKPRDKKKKPSRKPKQDKPDTQPLLGKKEAEKLGAGKPSSKTEKDKSKKPWTEKKKKFDKIRRKKDIEERRARLKAAGGGKLRRKPARKIETKRPEDKGPEQKRPEKATVSEPIHVKDLSAAIGVKSSEIIKKLMNQGVMATANQVIATDVAEIIALEFGTELTVEKQKAMEDRISEEFKNLERKNLTKRPVIATMLGHVDHGKTSLLDKIRRTQVAEGEAGGITQHISSYQITLNGRKVTFIDTPGHAAFTEMRARGANMTDVVVLVVAADDGIMPQTVEVINHAKAAEVPIIVALNKIDLPGTDINRIYAQLAEHELAPAEWGGSTDIVKTSATTGEGIEDLIEHLEFTGDLLDLKADDTIPGTGRVIEAEMSSTQGVVATLLIQEGTLKKGDVVLAGKACGRIRAIRDSAGKDIDKAASGTPVEVIGLDNVPPAGQKFYCINDLNRAKAAAEENRSAERENTLAQKNQVTLDNLFNQIEAGSIKELNIIIRADVQGSVDTLVKYLNELSTDEVKIKILQAATGTITEGDVALAEASNAIIIGFNVVPDEVVAQKAESKGVDIRTYNVIYQITEELKKSMAGLLEPEEKEEVIGRAVIRDTFKVSKLGTIAGCYVKSGAARRDAKARLIRDNIVIRDNLDVSSLKRFKDDAREVKTGLECGIKLKRFDDVKVNDVIEFFVIKKVKREL
jgi:translation initiation factor IF-2